MLYAPGLAQVLVDLMALSPDEVRRLETLNTRIVRIDRYCLSALLPMTILALILCFTVFGRSVPSVAALAVLVVLCVGVLTDSYFRKATLERLASRGGSSSGLASGEA